MRVQPVLDLGDGELVEADLTRKAPRFLSTREPVSRAVRSTRMCSGPWLLSWLMPARLELDRLDQVAHRQARAVEGSGLPHGRNRPPPRAAVLGSGEWVRADLEDRPDPVHELVHLGA
jgi:hypothetical protein